MEWNWCWSVTPFLMESTGDSEELESGVHPHDRDESQGASFRFDNENYHDDDDDDDAQSCSYDDHSSYMNTRTYGHDDLQSQRLIYEDEDGGEIDDDDDDDGEIVDDDDEKMKKEVMDLCDNKKQKRSHQKFCADSVNQGEIDRKFWEACLAA